MPKLVRVPNTSRTHTTGGRDGGAPRLDDRRVDVRLSIPCTPGPGIDREQLPGGSRVNIEVTTHVPAAAGEVDHV
jgi:hypothetical protein